MAISSVLNIFQHQSLKEFNSFSLDIYAEFFTEISSIDDLRALHDWKSNNDLPCLILGGGSNLLFVEDFQGLVAHISLMGISVEETENDYLITAAAGENWHEFVQYCVDQGYSGLENLSLIPGTVGAAPIQNIGAYGVEIKDVFESLTVFDLSKGETKTFDLDACEFAYRDSYFKQNGLDNLIITDVTFRLPKIPNYKTNYAGIEAALEDKAINARTIADVVIALRQSKLPDPEKVGNAGSFFKNPILAKADWETLKENNESLPGYPVVGDILDNGGGSQIKTSAAWLIEQSGWKGFREGDAGVSEQHALVLVNYADASGNELWQLAQSIIDSVKQKFGIELEPEPRVLK